MKTLHDNDSGYVSFYKDVLSELKTYNRFNSELLAERFEFWIEEAFYEPEFSDDILATITANRIWMMSKDLKD